MIEEDLIGVFAWIFLHVAEGRPVEAVLAVIIEFFVRFYEVSLEHVEREVSHDSFDDLAVVFHLSALEKTEHEDEYFVL